MNITEAASTAVGSNLVVQFVAVVLGAGLLRFVIDVVRVRRDKRTEPHETASIITEGAERAVMSMKASLEAAQNDVHELRGHVEKCEQQITERDATIAAQRADIDQLSREVLQLREAIIAIAESELDHPAKRRSDHP